MMKLYKIITISLLLLNFNFRAQNISRQDKHPAFKEFKTACFGISLYDEKCSFENLSFSFVNHDEQKEFDFIEITYKNKKYKYLFNFKFQKLGCYVKLFENNKKEIFFIIALDYEHNEDLFVFKTEENQIYFLKNMLASDPQDERGIYKYEFFQQKDSIELILNDKIKYFISEKEKQKIKERI